LHNLTFMAEEALTISSISTYNAPNQVWISVGRVGSTVEGITQRLVIIIFCWVRAAYVHMTLFVLSG
jgi:hypothetical protein